MANPFDIFDQPAAAPKGNPFDAFDAPAAPAKAAPPGGPGMLSDIGRTILPGLARGAAGVVSLPNTVMDYFDKNYLAPGAAAIVRATGKVPTSDLPGGDTRRTIADGFLSQEQALRPVEAVAGPLYHPKTLPGEIANTIAEFAPNALFGGGTAAQRLGQVVVPALASEGAGQAARVAAPEYEGPARFGGALLGGVGAAVAQAPRNGSALMREGLQGVTPDELRAAQALREDARSLPGGGFDLSLDEAVNRVTDGRAGRLSQISRVVAQSGGPGGEAMAGLYARRPGEIAQTGRNVFDAFGPLPEAPSRIGLDVQAAAQAGVAQTPEGLTLSRAREAVGPRVSDEAAGQVIQPSLRATADLREAVRAGQASRDYRLAREAPETVGIERMVTVERPGEPIVTQPAYSRPQFTDDAPRPIEPHERAAREAGEPGPESLARFIAQNGGLRLDGDAAATDLHRFNDATQDLRGVARQYGGAGFASRVRGTKQLRDNLDAALAPLPNGAGTSSLMDRFLTALEATGYRPQKGSDTAFNTEIRKLLESGKAPLPQAITDAATTAGLGGAAAGAGGAGAGAVLALRRGVSEGLLRHRVNRSGGDIARLLLDRTVPTSDLLPLLSSGRLPEAQRFIARLLASGASGGTSGNLPNRAGGPVRQGG